MKITVHDVGHGLCVSLVHQNGNVMLWDCGHSEDNKPSEFLPAQGIHRIDRFFVSNYDEDHLSDLPALRSNLHLPTLHRNKSISADQLRALKRQGGPISPAMESMLDMMRTYTAGPPEPPPAFLGVEFTTFCNSYGADFDDTNNISLVTILKCGLQRFIIPGDLEEKGWQGLLAQEAFRAELRGVTVFIASHHGRENGCCPDVFSLCKPRVIVFSDSVIQYTTQEMANTYNTYATGVTLNGQTRRVLSTRNDGPLTWTI